MTDAITTTVTWQDLIAQHDDELADLEDAYADVKAVAEEEFGDGALDDPLPGDPDLVTEERQALFVYQRQAAQYDRQAKVIQRQQHHLDTIREAMGDGDFTIKMLSGEETMEIEMELRSLAQQSEQSLSAIAQSRRNALTVDRAVVDAPEGVPRDDDGDPVPSRAPNTLALALWEQVQRFNNAGATDFRAEGLGDVSGPGADVSSETPTPSNALSESSASDDG